MFILILSCWWSDKTKTHTSHHISPIVNESCFTGTETRAEREGQTAESTARSTSVDFLRWGISEQIISSHFQLSVSRFPLDTKIIPSFPQNLFNSFCEQPIPLSHPCWYGRGQRLNEREITLLPSSPFSEESWQLITKWGQLKLDGY